MKQLIIFDLDGTLIDSLGDLNASLNYTLRKFLCPERTVEETRQSVGSGIRKLIERSVPIGTDSERIDKMYHCFLSYYRAHPQDYTRAYPQSIAALDVLKQDQSQVLAVLSNKADGMVKILCDTFYPGVFAETAGERAEIPRKPQPDGVFALMNRFGIDAAHTVYVGDSEVDVRTAQNAGLRGVFVDWGFRSRSVLESAGAECIVSDGNALLRALLKEPSDVARKKNS